MNGSRTSAGPRSPSWPSASGSDRPARMPDARWSTTSGQTSRSRTARLRARPRTSAVGPAPVISAKQPAIAGDLVTARPTRSTRSPSPTLVATSAPGVTWGAPAWTRRSCVRARQRSPRRARRRGGVDSDHQTQARPAPSSRPTTTPIAASALAAQQRGQIDPGVSEAVLVRRVAVAAHELLAAHVVEVRDLDDAVLDASGHAHDLPDAPSAPRVEPEVDDDVDRGRDGRHHKAVGHVLPGEQRERAELGERLACRVGVQGAHAGNSGVERNQEVERLGLADLSDDQPVRAHPQRLLDQSPQWDLTRPLEARLTALERDHVAVAEVELEDLLARDDPLPGRDRADQRSEHRRLACLGRSGDQDVESDAHGGIEERRRGRRQRTEGHEILEVPGARDVLADVDGPVAVRDVGDDDVQPLPAGQARVDERAGQVETVELTYGNEGTTYPPPSRYLRPHLPRPRGRRAWRRAPGGRLPGAGG